MASAVGSPRKFPAGPSADDSPPGVVRGARAVSILHARASGDGAERQPAPPACLGDLHLDEVIAAITAGREEYRLTPFFHAPLAEHRAVGFRQAVARDLERAAPLTAVRDFARGMREVRACLGHAAEGHGARQSERWHLDAAKRYADAVAGLARALPGAGCRSQGLRAVCGYLEAYAAGEAFGGFAEHAGRLHARLRGLRYTVLLRGPRVEVRRYAGEADLSAEVAQTFARFRQGGGEDYTFDLRQDPRMNHVERRILEGVATLFPEVFEELTGFGARYADFLDPVLGVFDREVQFYLAYLEFIAPLRAAGLEFCYPEVEPGAAHLEVRGGFDLALAAKRVCEGATVVGNDFHLRAPERIIVVSGPNQGGKTTFARMFGQLHYLGALGLPVPARRASLALPDRIFTHFEREERVSDRRGKLEDDLLRVRAILDRATPRSILLLNELFSATALRDALTLGREVARRVADLDALCVWVTFVVELAALGEKTVSMVSEVDPADPVRRTFRVVRRAADGLAYARALAEKHRLTRAAVLARLAR